MKHVLASLYHNLGQYQAVHDLCERIFCSMTMVCCACSIVVWAYRGLVHPGVHRCDKRELAQIWRVQALMVYVNSSIYYYLKICRMSIKGQNEKIPVEFSL